MSSTYECCPHCPESIHGSHLIPCIICASDAARLRAENERLRAKIRALTAGEHACEAERQIQAARALHHLGPLGGICAECELDWPCRTAKALDGDA